MRLSEKLAAIQLADRVFGLNVAIDALADAINDEDLPNEARDMINDSEVSRITTELYDCIKGAETRDLLRKLKDLGDIAR